MTENKKVKLKRFPNCHCSEDCLHEQGRGKLNLNFVTKHKSSPNGGGFRRGPSVAVAIAGPASGGITFWGNAKK